MDDPTHMQDNNNRNDEIEDDEGEDEVPKSGGLTQEWEDLHIKDALSRWLAQYDSTDAQEVRAARNFVTACTNFFEYLHLGEDGPQSYSYSIRHFLESVNAVEIYLHRHESQVFALHAATTVKHMRRFLEFALDRDLMPETPQEARKEIIFALHCVRAARAYATLSAAFHAAFVVHPVPFVGQPGVRKWYAQLLVHDVRADCLIVGRTGRRDELGDGIEDQEMDHSDLPPDPLKICVPKAASILIQPTDTILAYFYRVDADHFVLGEVVDYRPYDLAHRFMTYEDDDEAEEIPFTAPIREPLRARSLDPAFLVAADGRADVVPGTIIPVEPNANEISAVPFRIDDSGYRNREDRELYPPDDSCIEALAPPFAVWGPDGLPLHHMRRARDDPAAGEADTVLAHDDVGYRARRARLLALPGPFDVPGIPVYPQGVDIALPGPDYDVARMAGLMDARLASVRSATTFLGIPTSAAQSRPGILPMGHPAYRVFNMPPLSEAWYEAREPMYEDEPMDYSYTFRCRLLDNGEECPIHESVVSNYQ